jgi:hypothetical protein
MKYKFYILLAILFCSLQHHLCAQTDSLDVFRIPSKNTGSNHNAYTSYVGKNAISISIGHLGRGSALIGYERLINYTPFAIYAGFGFSNLDFIGQFSFDEESYLFENSYTEKKVIQSGKAIDCGLKYTALSELGGVYLALGFSSYENTAVIEISDAQYLANNVASTYRLNYSSKEFKIVYGFMNNVSSGFYNDFFIGTGFRFLNYQQLAINEIANPIYNGFNNYTQTILEIKKINKKDPKLWLFLGWKMGVRF